MPIKSVRDVMFYDGGSKIKVALIDEGENGSLETIINHDDITA